MGIRNYNKDHLNELAKPVAGISTPTDEPDHTCNDPLRFWTKHNRPILVDLHFLKDGESTRARKGGTWSGPFSGRETLIFQLAPVVQTLLEYAAPKTVTHYLHSFRGWWRLFDSVEALGVSAEVRMAPVVDVTDIGEIHRQRAFDIGMRGSPFYFFVRVLNIARVAQGLPQVYWHAPERVVRARHLPPKWQIDEIRFALKRGWFAALDRWERAEKLLAGCEPVNAEEARLLMNYKRFRDTLTIHKGPQRPTRAQLTIGLPEWSFAECGFNVTEMLAGFYPDARDIRMAFHLCLASTGWNPSVLLSLDIDDPFIEPHPKDPTRYLMRGHKARGDSEQVTEGLFKSQGAAGVVIQTLMRRTEPLRAALRQQLAEAESHLIRLTNERASRAKIDAARKKVVLLKQGVKSPWLYVTSSNNDVSWLTDRSYGRGLTGTRQEQFLDNVVDVLNQRRPADRKLSGLRPGDLRDAFAAFAYQVSGGMVLYVMKALGHKRLSSTQTYLDNSVINDQSNKLFRAFSQSLWHEIKVHRRVDPTVIAKWARDGDVSDEQRQRLHDYRDLRRSRIGVGCKDPTRPPKRIAPLFKADGKAMCHVQRCTLCLENAVIFPDSLIGLCKRLAELYFIKANMSSLAYIESSFGEEIENTEAALKVFPAEVVQEHLTDWQKRIDTGTHRIVDLDGAQVALA